MPNTTETARPTGKAPERYHARVRRDVIRCIDGYCGRVLDFGGGVGATALALKDAERASQVGVADRAAIWGKDTPLDFAMAGDFNDPAFIDALMTSQGPFDTILALDILEHLIDPWAAVARLHKGLAPNGRLVISVPNARNFNLVLPLVFANRWTYRDAGILDRTHLRFFVKSSAIELAACSGLEIEKIAAIPSSGGGVRLVRLLSLGLFNSFTDRQIVVIARKR